MTDRFLVLLRLLYFLIIFQLPLILPSQATDDKSATEDKGTSFFDKILSEEIKEMRIYMNFDTVIGEKDEKEYSDAIVVTLKNGLVVDSLPAEIRARGVMRNDYCSFPPIKLKVKKKALNEIGLNDINEVKIVVPCKSTYTYEKYVVREKLIYDLYNLVTPYSLRSHLVTIDYYDLESKKKKEKKVCIMIEHWEEIAHRLDGKVVERESGSEFIAEDQIAALVAVFQYMIGNTDYSYANMHNVGYIYVSENPKLTPIPYDFDYCGIVDAEYAIPNQKTKLTDVKQRLYQGICRDDQTLLRIIQHFKMLESKVMETIENFEALDKNDRVSIRRYLESFFDMLDNPQRSLSAFKRNC